MHDVDWRLGVFWGGGVGDRQGPVCKMEYWGKGSFTFLGMALQVHGASIYSMNPNCLDCAETLTESFNRAYAN